MADATIIYDITMTAWPPTTYLVHLSEPLKRFDPETGDPAGEYDYVAVCCKDSVPKAAHIFPSTETGDFVDSTMTPLRTRDFGVLHSVLKQLGYTPTN